MERPRNRQTGLSSKFLPCLPGPADPGSLSLCTKDPTYPGTHHRLRDPLPQTPSRQVLRNATPSLVSICLGIGGPAGHWQGQYTQAQMNGC